MPSLHLADVAIRKPSAKFKIGQKLRCRVLAVDATARKLKLTNKRTLVASELPVVTSYADAPLGAVVHGFVAAVKSFGLIVSFYNGISGLLPKSELQAEEVEGGLESLYERGQVLRCKVIKNNERKNKLVLSLNLSAPGEQEQVRPSSRPCGSLPLLALSLSLLIAHSILHFHTPWSPLSLS